MVSIESVYHHIIEAETRLSLLEKQTEELENICRVKKHLLQLQLSSASLKTAPSIYYEWSLEKRAQFLQCQVPHLCKSILVENTACTHTNTHDICDSKYYCVILQYNSKLNCEQLMRVIRNLIPESKRLGRKHYNFQHAPSEVSAELTGFRHNGVSPYGMKTKVPIIVSDGILALNPPFIWLGGGSEFVKLRIGVSHLISSLNAYVGMDITNPRTDL